MEDSSKKPEGNSRRQVLKLGMYGLGAIGAMSVAGAASAQVAKKAAQTSVKYQQSPKDGKHCAQCQHFIAPSSCKVVDGAINANGYCILFSKKG